MADELESVNVRASRIKVKIGDSQACHQAISAAIAKRAYEIYQRRGCGPGRDREDWQLAEKEVLRTLSCCGILDSKNEIVISMFCSALGFEDIEEIEVCVESHRLILVGKKGSGSTSEEDTTIYRVLPLTEEVDPSSAKVWLKQRDSLLEIEVRKHCEEALGRTRAA